MSDGSVQLLVVGLIVAYLVWVFWRQILAVAAFCIVALVFTGLLTVVTTLNH